MGWESFLKAALRFGGKMGKAAGGTVGAAVTHPQQTLRGVANTAKTAAVGGSLGYVGWKKLTTDKSVVDIVSDAVIGEDTTQKISDTVTGIGDGVKGLKDSVTGLTDNVNDAITNVDSKWSGMSNFLRGIFSGNGGDMMNNFFSNIASGKVNGLSLVGLVASALLVFGRFGWLGKIAGAVLAMMMIGNNADMRQMLNGAGQSQSPEDNALSRETERNTGGGRRR